MDRMSAVSRPQAPPRIVRSARPSQSRNSDSAQMTALLVTTAYAAPIGPTRSTSMNKNASGTVTQTDRIASHIGVRLSPAARIAEAAMNHTV